MMNISTAPVIDEKVAELFRVIGQPVRIQILLVIGEGEACVCHLEAYLGQRQVAISQHLMVMRDAGLVTTRRDGRNIYYRLAKPEILDLARQAAAIVGIPAESWDAQAIQPVTPCPCPLCNPDGLGCAQLRA
jgi:DNA-binding transcriptional ArsR family regulator